MNIKLITFFLVALFISIGCNLSKKLSKPDSLVQVSEIQFEKLECIELSENLKTISSQNDEVLVLFYLTDDNYKVVEKERSHYMKFDSLNYLVTISNKIIIPKGLNRYILKIILIEQDTYKTEQEIEELVSQNLDKSKEELTSLLLDDDLLDMRVVEITNGKMNQINQLKFWGIHLFDEYEYKLYFTVK